MKMASSSSGLALFLEARRRSYKHSQEKLMAGTGDRH